MGLFRKSLSAITGGFQKTIDDLETFHAGHSAEIDQNNEVVTTLSGEIDHLKQRNGALHAEREQALAIKAKVQSLISA